MITLYDHQEEALDKTKDKNRVAYYLDMGLGKTFVGSEKLKALDANINLVICQKSKLNDWYKHFQKYYQDYNTIIYTKTQEIPNNSVVIINYDLVWRRPELLQLKDFTLMLDESSMIKTSNSERTKFILKLKAKNVILLSGTPVGGKYEELLSQCKLLGWKISKKAFWSNYIEYFMLDIGGFKMPKITGYKNVERLKQKLRDHGAIFMKTEEVLKLPEQIENVVEVEITSHYKKFKKNRLIEIEGIELVGDTSLTNLLYQRQLASQYNSNKTAALKDLLESTNDRVIIFYNFTNELEKILAICNKLEKPISIVNGNSKDLKEYETQSNSVTCIQYQSGAAGLNLQKANKIIYFSITLSAELFMQSKKRIHRIGQNDTCFYYYLITKESIEEDIFKSVNKGIDYTNALFEKDEVKTK